LLLLFDYADVAGQLPSLVIELRFRSSGGIDADGGRPEESERVLNHIEWGSRARRRGSIGKLLTQIVELLLGGADLSLQVPLAIVLGPERRFSTRMLIGGRKLGVQFAKKCGQRGFGSRGRLRGA
jgi:hypothetical protein